MAKASPNLMAFSEDLKVTARFEAGADTGALMTVDERRRVTLFDVMALIAATAIGLSMAQLGWPRNAVNPAGAWIFISPVFPGKPSGCPSKTWMLPVAERVAPFLPCLAGWTGAFLATRLHGPRPRRRRLVLQPGLVVAVAALSMLVVESALLIGSAWIDGRFGWSSPARNALFAANGVVLLAHHAGLGGGGFLAHSHSSPADGGPSQAGSTAGNAPLGCTWIFVGPLASLLIDHATWWGNFISG